MDKYIITDLIKYVVSDYISYFKIIALNSTNYICNNIRKITRIISGKNDVTTEKTTIIDGNVIEIIKYKKCGRVYYLYNTYSHKHKEQKFDDNFKNEYIKTYNFNKKLHGFQKYYNAKGNLLIKVYCELNRVVNYSYYDKDAFFIKRLYCYENMKIVNIEDMIRKQFLRTR
jgi:hypothetical protein